MDMKKDEKVHCFSVLVHNQPGVLYKVTSMITRRGFNIETISAGPARDQGLVRISLTVKGDAKGIEQVQKQLYKVVETVKVSTIHAEDRVEREVALIKIKAPNGAKQEILKLVEIYRGSVVDTAPNGFIVQIIGTSKKVDAFINLFPKNQIQEVARTGVIAMNRWAAPVKPVGITANSLFTDKKIG